jgi:hypothetical protein
MYKKQIKRKGKEKEETKKDISGLTALGNSEFK